MMFGYQVILTIVIASLITYGTRLLPFMVFAWRKELPLWVSYLGQVLPPAAIALLVVYCFKDVALFITPYGFKELIGVGVTIVVHLLKRNYIVSIALGTLVYIILSNL